MHHARLVMKMKTRSSLGFKMLGGISADSSPHWCLCGVKIDCSGLACGYLIWVQFLYLMDQCQAFSSVMTFRWTHQEKSRGEWSQGSPSMGKGGRMRNVSSTEVGSWPHLSISSTKGKEPARLHGIRQEALQLYSKIRKGSNSDLWVTS